MMVRRQLLGIVAGIPVFFVLVTACGDEGSQVVLPEKNIDQWVMPLDDYAVGSITETDYATGLLVQACMEEAGFSFEVPWVDINAATPATENAASRRLFNIAVAGEWGYHSAPSNQPNQDQIAELNSMAMSEDADAKWSECSTAAYEVVPPPDGNAQLAVSLASADWDAALLDDRVIDAAADWRECMVPQGVSDLPEMPTEMPSESVMARFGLGGDGGADVGVSPEEISLATADATCRESSHFRQALYDAEWEREASSVQENADALVRAKEQNAARRAAALDVINQAGAS